MVTLESTTEAPERSNECVLTNLTNSTECVLTNSNECVLTNSNECSNECVLTNSGEAPPETPPEAPPKNSPKAIEAPVEVVKKRRGRPKTKPDAPKKQAPTLPLSRPIQMPSPVQTPRATVSDEQIIRALIAHKQNSVLRREDRWRGLVTF